jgi:SAM-dependent methyltransferase
MGYSKFKIKTMTGRSLINYYLQKTKTKNYLEIGLHTGFTFSQINADIKDSIDPLPDLNAKYKMTSDDFFTNVAPTLNYKYDVIFIDGLHHSDQVDKDIENSINFLNEGGVIILHDCNPISEMRQRVPADFDIWHYGWNGDVWKSILKFRKKYSYSDFKTFVVDSDEGLGVILPNRVGQPCLTEVPNYSEWDYNFFDKNRKEILNLKSVEEFVSMENY